MCLNWYIGHELSAVALFMMSNWDLFSISDYSILFLSKKIFSSKELMSSLPDVPTRRRLVRPRMNFRSNQDQHCSLFFMSRAKSTITDEKTFMVFIEFFFRIFKILRIIIFLNSCFMNWERDSASAKIDD